jgi:hypothetical protein
MPLMQANLAAMDIHTGSGREEENFRAACRLPGIVNLLLCFC